MKGAIITVTGGSDVLPLSESTTLLGRQTLGEVLSSEEKQVLSSCIPGGLMSVGQCELCVP